MRLARDGARSNECTVGVDDGAQMIVSIGNRRFGPRQLALCCGMVTESTQSSCKRSSEQGIVAFVADLGEMTERECVVLHRLRGSAERVLETALTARDETEQATIALLVRELPSGGLVCMRFVVTPELL